MSIFPSPFFTYLTHVLIFVCLVALGYVSRKKIKHYYEQLTQKDVSDEEAKANRELLVVGLCIGGVIAMMLMFIGMPSFVGLLVGMIAGWAVPRMLESRRRVKYLKDFDSQLAESLQTVGASLKAGLTLKDAMMVAAENCPPIFAREVSTVVKEYRFGVPIEQALDHLRERIATPSCNIAFGAMIISSKLGGRLPDMLQEITRTIRERERVEGKLLALTAQGRAQAFILCAAPPAMGIGMWLYDESKMRLLTDFWVGQILLGLAIVLELVGIFVTAKVMKLEV